MDTRTRTLAARYKREPTDAHAHALARAIVRQNPSPELRRIYFNAPSGANLARARVGPHDILVSYGTPVAFYCEGCEEHSEGYYQTTKYHSRTTRRHVNSWMAENGINSTHSVTQKECDATMEIA